MSGIPHHQSPARRKITRRLNQAASGFASCLALLLATPAESHAQEPEEPPQAEAPPEAPKEAPVEEAPSDEAPAEAPPPEAEPDAALEEGEQKPPESEEADAEGKESAAEGEEPSSDESAAEEDVGSEALEDASQSDASTEPETPEPAEGADSDPVPPPAPPTRESEAEHGSGKPKIKWREKPLHTTVGQAPTVRDLGNEADIFIDDADEVEEKNKKWKLDMKGFLRASARFSYGPAHSGKDSFELHAPARIPGLSSGDWDHIGVVPNPSAKAFFSAGTPTVSVNVILGGQPPLDEGYVNLKDTGWFLDAYLVLKYPRVFGHRGGLAVTAGSFGHRYGNAGRASTGYYRNYLFGKTHSTGAVITADYDLTEHWELILEHGIGAKDDSVPWINPSTPTRPSSDYLQGQGDLPQGSNFVHHGHAQLRHDYWLRLGSHLMTSWSPNDRGFEDGEKSREARLTISGVEANVDVATGNGYLGYAHMDAKDVIPLSNGIQTMHASRGADIKKIYFGYTDRITGLTPSNDSGTVDTVLFQYILKMGNLLQIGPDFDIGLFGAYAHVNSPIQDPNITTQEHIEYDRIKWGAEVRYEVLPFMVTSLRFDNVHTEVQNPDRSFSAISPNLAFFTKKGSKEAIILNYSYFIYGSEVYPGSPFRELAVSPDPHFFGLSALMSL